MAGNQGLRLQTPNANDSFIADGVGAQALGRSMHVVEWGLRSHR